MSNVIISSIIPAFIISRLISRIVPIISGTLIADEMDFISELLFWKWPTACR